MPPSYLLLPGQMKHPVEDGEIGEVLSEGTNF